MTTPTSIQPSQLPATIRGYLAAHAARDTDAALRAFSPAAVVVDQGQTFRGTDEILGFLRDAGAEFTYTTELIGAQRIDDARWVATNRLEGDFPGGVAELDYRFTMDGDLHHRARSSLRFETGRSSCRSPQHPSCGVGSGGSAAPTVRGSHHVPQHRNDPHSRDEAHGGARPRCLRRLVELERRDRPAQERRLLR